MCIFKVKTSSKQNGLTYRHKRNKKHRIPFIFQQWKQKKEYQNKWRLTHEKLPVEKN